MHSTEICTKLNSFRVHRAKFQRPNRGNYLNIIIIYMLTGILKHNVFPEDVGVVIITSLFCLILFRDSI